MQSQTILRWSASTLVPLGVVLAVFGSYLGEPITITLGVASSLFGIGCYVILPSLLSAEFKLTDLSTITIISFQLVATVLLFGLLDALIGDSIAVIDAFHTGVSLTTLNCSGVVGGVFFGGGVPYLVYRREFFAKLNESFVAKMGGFSMMLGTYLCLLVIQPTASVVYAGSYALSRISALVGIYATANR